MGHALSIPGTIEAEHFDNGSDGISYHDKDRQNRGEGYRLETGVDVYALKDKPDEYAVGYAQKEEWLEYTVNIDNERIQESSYFLMARQSLICCRQHQTIMIGKVILRQQHAV